MAWTWIYTPISSGKILPALITEIQNGIKQLAADLYATPSNAGTGSSLLTLPISKSWRAGSSTTNGTTGRAIAFGAAEADTNYSVSIAFGANPGGDTGSVYVTKTVSGFTLYCSGPTTGIAFDWLIIRHQNPA